MPPAAAGRWLVRGPPAAAGRRRRASGAAGGRRGAASSAGGRLLRAVLRVEVEERAHRVHVQVALVAAGHLLHLDRRHVQDLVDDARGEHVDAGPLLVGEVAQPVAQALELAAADVLHGLAQRRDGGHDLEAAQPVVHARELLLDDALGVLRLLLALVAVVLDHVLQVVDVVEVGVAHAVDLGVEVARHGDVDEEHGAVPAALEGALDDLPGDDVVRRRGGADDDVGDGEVLLEVLEPHRLSADSPAPAPSTWPASGWRPGSSRCRAP